MAKIPGNRIRNSQIASLNCLEKNRRIAKGTPSKAIGERASMIAVIDRIKGSIRDFLSFVWWVKTALTNDLGK